MQPEKSLEWSKIHRTGPTQKILDRSTFVAEVAICTNGTTQPSPVVPLGTISVWGENKILPPFVRLAWIRGNKKEKYCLKPINFATIFST